jgi:hypothetical protein
MWFLCAPSSSCAHRRLCFQSPALHLPLPSPTRCCPTRRTSSTTQAQSPFAQDTQNEHPACSFCVPRAHASDLGSRRTTATKKRQHSAPNGALCCRYDIQVPLARDTQIEHPTCSFCVSRAHESDLVHDEPWQQNIQVSLCMGHTKRAAERRWAMCWNGELAGVGLRILPSGCHTRGGGRGDLGACQNTEFVTSGECGTWSGRRIDGGRLDGAIRGHIGGGHVAIDTDVEIHCKKQGSGPVARAIVQR